MKRSMTRRTMAALALGFCALFGFALPAPAQAASAAVAVSSSDAGRVVATTDPASDEFEPEDAADWVKDNAALVIVGVGILLVIGFWKFITR